MSLLAQSAASVRQGYVEKDIAAPCCDGYIKVRIYGGANDGTPRPGVVYLHGGFFNSGSIEDADAVARAVADTATVISIDYPLAPGEVFPAALESSYLVLEWAAKHAAALHIDPMRLFVGGDQAGGNLAAALAMVARDRLFNRARARQLIGQVLLTPLLDPAQATPAMRETEGCPCYKAWADYLSRPSDFHHPYAAPMHARRLSGLPSTLLIAAADDPMRDEAAIYATHLIEAGIDVQFQQISGSRRSLVASDDPKFPHTTAILREFLAKEKR